MNKPYMKYVLGVAVVLVWGFFFKELFYKLDNKPAAYSPSVYIPLDEAETSLSFDLELNYQDPFLSTQLGRKPIANSAVNSNKVRSIQVNAATLAKRKKTQQKVKFPKLNYNGYVSVDGKPKVARVDFSGKAIQWKLGEKHEEFLLGKITKDSIMLYKDEQRKSYPLDLFN